MLNMNSPTVQAMMNNLPQGVGNMPAYFGNTPTVTIQQTPMNTPYPSPKEMLMQAGQQNIYQPTSFAPRNIVGGYNPGFEAAFNGYVNPYMGYGYSGYGYNNYYPMDEDTRRTLEMATFNGLDYNEQVQMECDLYKKISRTVSKNLGRSEEDTKRCESAFNPYNKYPQQQNDQKTPIKPIHIQIKIGDRVVADMPSREVNIYNFNFLRNSEVVDNMRSRDAYMRSELAKRAQTLYSNASERKMDDLDILDFFNNGANSLIVEDLIALANYQNMIRSSQLYDKEKFGQRLLINNGFKPKSQRNAIDRFVGRYGVMPDGRPVTPGHDPSIAESFSYDPGTGQYTIKPPNFISNSLEQARYSFIKSLEE